MKKISEEELNIILENHKLWLETNEMDGKRADLSNANLSGVNLMNYNLRFADLSGANLSDANLECINLNHADLSDAILTNVNLELSDLVYADLSGADLTGANLTKANLTKANLFNANLNYAKLYRAILRYADLTRANLIEADLYHANNDIDAAKLNEVGNVVIAGHNYRNGMFFSNLKKVSTGDKIKITDVNGRTLVYTVYEKYETTPEDVAYITRNVGETIEITLVTCTDNSEARIIVKAKV